MGAIVQRAYQLRYGSYSPTRLPTALWELWGFKYLMVNKDEVIEEKSQAGFLHADDVCLMGSHEQHLQTIFEILADALKNML